MSQKQKMTPKWALGYLYIGLAVIGLVADIACNGFFAIFGIQSMAMYLVFLVTGFLCAEDDPDRNRILIITGLAAMLLAVPELLAVITMNPLKRFNVSDGLMLLFLPLAVVGYVFILQEVRRNRRHRDHPDEDDGYDQ